ncbi:uncharacterized protein [Centroberyx affinis]|uniref:uncharacterized protein n=1 Tax=Centroberyx affinis TaxID=166261 RepID=UPI003A5BB308
MPAETVRVRAGGDATLTCPLPAGGASTLSWYQQAAGRSPRLVLNYRSTRGPTVTYGSGFSPGKFSAGADGSLLLRGSEESDSAVYYCGVSQFRDPKKEAARQATGETTIETTRETASKNTPEKNPAKAERASAAGETQNQPNSRAADWTEEAGRSRASRRCRDVSPGPDCAEREESEQDGTVMEAGLAFILLPLLLLGCSVAPPVGRQFGSGMVFSGGTQLFVEGSSPSSPSVQLLSSVPAGQEAPPLLLCLLSGLGSAPPDVVWWINDTAVRPAEARALWAGLRPGGAYAAVAIWELPAADRGATYWCGTVQQGRVHRQKTDSLCWGG